MNEHQQHVIKDILREISGPITLLINTKDILNNTHNSKDIQDGKTMASSGLVAIMKLYYAAYSDNIPDFNLTEAIVEYLEYRDIKIDKCEYSPNYIQCVNSIANIILAIAPHIPSKSLMSISNDEKKSKLYITIKGENNSNTFVKKLGDIINNTKNAPVIMQSTKCINHESGFVLLVCYRERSKSHDQ